MITYDLTPSIYGDTKARFAMGAEYQLTSILAFRGGVAQNFGTNWINRDVMVGMGIEYPIEKYGYLQAGITYLFDNLVNTPRVGLAFTW